MLFGRDLFGGVIPQPSFPNFREAPRSLSVRHQSTIDVGNSLLGDLHGKRAAVGVAFKTAPEVRSVPRPPMPVLLARARAFDEEENALIFRLQTSSRASSKRGPGQPAAIDIVAHCTFPRSAKIIACLLTAWVRLNEARGVAAFRVSPR